MILDSIYFSWCCARIQNATVADFIQGVLSTPHNICLAEYQNVTFSPNDFDFLGPIDVENISNVHEQFADFKGQLKKKLNSGQIEGCAAPSKSATAYSILNAIYIYAYIFHGSLFAGR